MFRHSRISALLFCGALFVVSCGRGLDDTAPGTTLPAPTSTSTTTTTLSIEPVAPPTLEVWVEPDYVTAVRAVAEEFTTALGVEVTVTGHRMDDVSAALASGDLPADVFAASHLDMSTAMDAGLAAPLPIGARVSEFLDPAVEAFSLDGELYGIPYRLETEALFFDPQHVPTAPTGFSQIKAVCDDLGALPVAEIPPDENTDEDTEESTTTTTRPPPQVPGCTGVDSSDPETALLFMRSTGLMLLGGDDTGIDGTAAHQGADFLTDRVADGVLVPVGGRSAVLATYIEGEIAYLIAPADTRYELSAAEVPYQLASLPLIAGAEPVPWMEAVGFLLNARSEYKHEASLFLLEYLAAAPAMADLFAVEGAVPAHKATADLATADPEMATLLGLASSAMPMPADPKLDDILATLGGFLPDLFGADPDTDVILAAAAAAVRDLP
ncbi:MAG: extracellular solute-binding protein [Acidimicrobiia bacterium]